MFFYLAKVKKQYFIQSNKKVMQSAQKNNYYKINVKIKKVLILGEK